MLINGDVGRRWIEGKQKAQMNCFSTNEAEKRGGIGGHALESINSKFKRGGGKLQTGRIACGGCTVNVRNTLQV